jgi:ElaA protein
VYRQPSIGRLAIADGHRGKGQGRLLCKEALAQCKTLYPQQELKIQAQVYLERFYQSFGFKTISEPYPDFGIMHIDMMLAN